jgi:tetratricopeptide (TPR) repeat protein
MKRELLAVLLILCSIGSVSQELDTTIFTTDFEKKVFMDYLASGHADPVLLFSCVDYRDGIEVTNSTRVNTIIKEFDTEKFRNKNQKKQIKEIYTHIQESFLKKYDEQAYFNDIFPTGKYNCVTASALIALLFENLHIPHEIKETAIHVYLVAGKGSDLMYIETTMPKFGVFHFDNRFKNNYVNFLLESETISLEEYANNSLDELFREYYDVDSSINLVQLAAVQYNNEGYYCYEEERYQEAANSYEKAIMLYPSALHKEMFNLCLAYWIDEQNLGKEYSGKNLAKLLNINMDSYERLQLILEIFEDISGDMVFRDPDKDAYIAYFDEFKRYAADSADLGKFDMTYSYHLAYLDYSYGDYCSSLKNLEIAYAANPMNLVVKQLVQSAGAAHLMTDIDHESNIDSLEYYFEKFPFLFDNNLFQRYYTYCIMRASHNQFLLDDFENGSEYLEKLEQLKSDDPALAIDMSLVEEIYNDLATHYVIEGDYSSAIHSLERGLTLAPQSYRLRERKKELERYGNSPVISINRHIIPVNPVTLSFEEQFNSSFPKCWQVREVKSDAAGVANSSYHQLKITAKKNNEAEFFYEDVNRKGRWAIREISHLMYLVPDKDKDDYLVFKVMSIDQKFLVIKPYENDVLKDIEIVMEECPE